MLFLNVIHEKSKFKTNVYQKLTFSTAYTTILIAFYLTPTKSVYDLPITN